MTVFLWIVGAYLGNIILGSIVLGCFDAHGRDRPIVEWFRSAPPPLLGWGVAHQLWPLALWWAWKIRR